MSRRARRYSRDLARERIEQVVEVLVSRRRARQRVQALDLVPQRVAVEHEARARHDVRPVARLVLLQQGEALVLLAQQPGNRPLHIVLQPCAQAAVRGAPVEEVHGEQPPQRRVDAAQVPEIRLVAARVHELRDLPVGRLVCGQGQQAGGGLLLQASGSAQRHPQGAHGGVPGEHCAVAARAGPRARRGRQDAVGGEIALQQLDRVGPALLDQPGVIVWRCFACGHGIRSTSKS